VSVREGALVWLMILTSFESSGVGVRMMASGLLDPEFWNEGYALREGVALMGGSISRFTIRRKAILLFLEHVAELVLSAGNLCGKAVRLIRALGGPNDFNNWRTFADDSLDNPCFRLDGVEQKKRRSFCVSVDTLSRFIYDGLLPIVK
jgi:gamma-tubulin complex component 5